MCYTPRFLCLWNNLSFSCFFAKRSSREAMKTAEPPEPLTVQHSDFIMTKQNLQGIGGPAARHLSVSSVYSVDS